MMSDGVSMISSKGRAMHSPSTSRIAPHRSDKISAVCTACLARFSSLAPMDRAMTTLAPTARPVMMVMNRLTTELVLPTAARARSFWAENRPTTATSAELNSCWSILVAAMGREKKRICFHSVPCRKSLRVFVIPLMVC